MSILRSISLADKYSGPLYLGKVPTYHVDLLRMERVMNRTVRGLLWHETKTVLAPEFELGILPVDRLDLIDPRGWVDVQKLAALAIGGGVRDIGNGVFRYAVSWTPDEPAASVWWCEIYGSVHFLATVLRNSDYPPRHAARRARAAA